MYRKEKKLRNRKSNVVLAKVYVEEYYPNMQYSKKITEAPRDLAELIHRLFVRQEGTVSVFPNGKIVVQCDQGRNRSVEDLFLVTINYKPKITYERVQQIVNEIDHLFNHEFCNVVRREVYYTRNLNTTERKIREELGKNNIKFDGNTIQSKG